MAQTLYKTANIPNQPRIFLQTMLDYHSLWKNQSFWEDFIKCKIEIILVVINEELHSQKNYNIYTFETSIDKIKRIKATVLTQLMSFSYSMISFKFRKERLKDIIIQFSNYYEIEENSLQEILKNVEDYCLLHDKSAVIEVEDKKQDNLVKIESDDLNQASIEQQSKLVESNFISEKSDIVDP